MHHRQHRSMSTPFIVIDIGNTTVKAGLFDDVAGEDLPQPREIFAHDAAADVFDELQHWLADQPVETSTWHIASVNDRARDRLVAWLSQRRPPPTMHPITHDRLPLAVDVAHPERVGIDRLLASAAINRVRDPHRPAIVIDAGTAITVDCVSAAGAFLGGAILPGMKMAGQALDRYTEKLPLIDVTDLSRPTPIGRDTAAAISSGIFWGTRGAVSQLIAQMKKQLQANPQLYITGGDAERLQIDDARAMPHLVLSGIALAAQLRFDES